MLVRWRFADVRVVLEASLKAAGALLLTLMLIAEIAAVPTAKAGVSSSVWTPITSVTAAVFGGDALHGDFDLGSIAFGLLAIAAASVLAGGLGACLIVYSLGRRPHPLAGLLLGTAWGLAVEILVVNLFLNWLQAENGVYDSLPNWGWWVGMGAWGATLGLALSQEGRRRTAALAVGGSAT
jgi:hypothetical protein